MKTTITGFKVISLTIPKQAMDMQWSRQWILIILSLQIKTTLCLVHHCLSSKQRSFYPWQGTLSLVAFCRSWFRRNRSKIAWKLVAMQQMLSSKGQGAHTRKSPISTRFISWTGREPYSMRLSYDRIIVMQFASWYIMAACIIFLPNPIIWYRSFIIYFCCCACDNVLKHGL